MPKSALEKKTEEAMALGLDLTGKETLEELTEKIKEAKAAAKKAGKKVIFYWVKVKSFISETQTIEPGLYKTTEKNERLSRSKSEYVEAYEGEIPDAKLFKIAELYRVAVYKDGGQKTRPTEEILAELVKEL